MIKEWVCRIVGHKDEALEQGRAGDRFVVCRRCGRAQNAARDYSRPPLDIPAG